MLIRPLPFPDELDRGFLGRVRSFNGFRTEKEAVAMMAEWAGAADRSRYEVSVVELLSKVAGCSLPEFVQRHTTLPLRRGITSYHPDLPHGCESNRSMLGYSGMRLTRPGAYFCAECVEADQQFHGLSYWRRELQTPGLLLCPKHATPLRYMGSEAAFLTSPAEFVSTSHVVSSAWAQEVRENEAVQRYLDICSGVMDRDRPLSVKHVSLVLKERAAALGWQTFAGKVGRPLLSDAVIKAFGRPWLATVFPALADKLDGVLLEQIDGVLYRMTSASSATAYILAASVLFSSADIAMDELSRASETAPRLNRGRRAAVSLDEQGLRDAYVGSRGNHTKTANRFSEVNKHVIITRLNGMGLPALTDGSEKRSFDAAFAFLVEGRSLIESAAIGGISIEAMEALVRKASAGLAQVLMEILRPQEKRGSGGQWARQLTPHEVTFAAGWLVSEDTRG